MLWRVLLPLIAAIDSEGWNDNIKWSDLSTGLREARTSKRPIFTLIHQSWCGACKALKPQFAKSKELEQLSQHFVMVNAGNEKEPKDMKFKPEGLKGGYYPRIIFLKPDGSRIDSIKGPNPEYSAYFSKPQQIAAAMKEALLASGIDLDAEKKAADARAAKEKEEAAKKHAESVPGMLEAIFSVVDVDHDRVLSHPEFVTFVTYMKGQVPTEEQYEKMCKMHKSPGGLSFDKMRAVYASRSAEELKSVYDKVVQKQEL